MASAPDIVDSDHDRLEKTQLAWRDHLEIVLSTALIFIVVTLIYFVVVNPTSPPGDKVEQTIRWGTFTGLEILAVLVIQSLFDGFVDNKAGSTFSKRFTRRARQFGLRRPRKGMLIARDTLLILLCALVPMDFLTYMVPGILQYIATSSTGRFFSGFTIEAFVVIGIVYNITTGVREEFVFRGYFLKRFTEKGTPQSAWVCTSILFGILHVSFVDILTFPAGPLLWGITAVLAGLLFGGYVTSTKRMLPAVLAHGIGNFISSTTIWAYFTTNGFSGEGTNVFLFLFYGPMLAAGLVLAVACRRTIGQAGTALKRLGRDLKQRTVRSDVLVMIVIMVILWLLSLAIVY